MARPKSLADKYPNWGKRFSDVPSCSTVVVTMFLAYASHVPADKAKKVGGPADYWEISFKEAYETLSDSITSDTVKKHVSGLNTFILNFCLMSSASVTFENPDGAPDTNAYINAGFPKTAPESLYPSYTSKAEAKEWLEFITGSKASSYDELFTAAIKAADKLSGDANDLVMNTIRYLAPANMDLSKYLTEHDHKTKENERQEKISAGIAAFKKLHPHSTIEPNQITDPDAFLAGVNELQKFYKEGW